MIVGIHTITAAAAAAVGATNVRTADHPEEMATDTQSVPLEEKETTDDVTRETTDIQMLEDAIDGLLSQLSICHRRVRL